MEDDETEGQVPPADDEGQDETTGATATAADGSGTPDADGPDSGDAAKPPADDDSIYGGGADPKSIYGGG